MAEFTTIARPYGKAIFAYAVEQKAEASWLSLLSRCAELVQDADLSRILKNPGVAATKKAAMLAELTQELSVEGKEAFFDVLAYYGRFLVLPEIKAEFERHLAGQQQALDVTITSAFPLEDAELRILEERLKKRYAGKTIRIETAVDQSLIGGFEIRSSDTVIDASVRGRLAKVAEALTA